MVRIYIFFLLLVFVFEVIGNEKPILKVVGESWRGTTNSDGTGTYWDIVRAVYGDNFKIVIETMSWTRAKELVKSGRADVLVGTYDTVDSLLLPEQHIDTEYPIHILFDKSKFSFNELADLKHKVIAGRKGWGLESFLPEQSKFYGVDSIKNISRLILSGRIDGALTYSYNLQLADPQYQLSHKKLVPELPLYLAFTANDKGQRLKRLYDVNMDKLIQNKGLLPYFSSSIAYEHANLDTRVKSLGVDWHLVPKIFNTKLKKLEVIPWELNTSKYLSHLLSDIKIEFKVNGFAETKKRLKNQKNTCAINIRKRDNAKNNIVYSSAIHAFIQPRLFILKDKELENKINSLMVNDKVAIQELLLQYADLKVVVKDNFSILDKLMSLLPSDYSKRILAVEKGDYNNLINLLAHKRVDALIVWPNMIADLHNANNQLGLTSYAINEQVGNTLLTYVGCHNDLVGKQIIRKVNRILKNEVHQQSIYLPLLNKMDVNSANSYKKLLFLDNIAPLSQR